MTKYTAVYKTGTGRRGRGHCDACSGNFESWKRETKDLGTSSMGRGDEWGGDAGRQIRGRRDVNDYCKSRREMRYQSLSS